MISFFCALAVLVLGYLIYGTVVERVFKPSDRPTPAVANPDNVDYVPLSTPKAFLVQFLNIAGLGPIFGAISGALWGPCVYLWIVFGTLLAGGVHDFLAGMLSVRNDGASISEVTGKYLGPVMHNVMRVFSVVLLVMVGVVFMVGPAGLLARLTPDWLNTQFWVIIILIYYFLATLLPIDKIIGKVYPVFGVLLILMAFGIAAGTIYYSGERPMMELTLANLYPGGLDNTSSVPIWPLMFITVACGAISGFHATQSPIVSRCIKSEREGRKIFYGAMVAEGIIALIWAAAAVTFFWNPDGSGLATLKSIGGGNPNSVYEMCIGLLGSIGGLIAMIGVIVCPITSGDTAFRSARMTLFDWFKLDEKKVSTRLCVAIPLLLAGFGISLLDYSVVWRYFSWSNQTLAMVVLWAGAVFLATKDITHKYYCWLAAAPATFMSAVSATYLLYAPECLNLGSHGESGITISYIAGIVVAVAFLCVFLCTVYRHPEKSLEKQSKIHLERKSSVSD